MSTYNNTEKVIETINQFINGNITKVDAEKQLSLVLGGSWVLSNIAGEWLPVKYQKD